MDNNSHSNFQRRLACIFLCAAAFLQSCSQNEPPKFQSVDYNIIFISIDTLRADHLGAYGYPKDTSPNFDALAKDSILFRTAISQAPSTLPSHGSLFTGMLPINHGAFAALQSPIKLDLQTIAEIMRDADFRTISYNGGGLVNEIFGFGRGFEQYNSDLKNDLFRNKVDLAIDWLDENSADKFFMFLHTYEVHDPYAPEQKYLDLVETGYSGKLGNDIGPREIAAINAHDANLSTEDVEHVKNLYNAEIRSMDEGLGRLITYLKEENLYDSTIIVFTSDHGEEFGEHGVLGQHFFTLYDELVHVPFTIKMPRSQLAGKEINSVVRGVDLLPTLLDLVDIPYTADFDGQSLAALIMGTGAGPSVAISQQDSSDPVPPSSIRTNKYKFIQWLNVLDNPDVDYLWVQDKFEFYSDSTQVTVPMASVEVDHAVRILHNGIERGIKHLTPTRKNYPLILSVGGQPVDISKRRDDEEDPDESELILVTIESINPCTAVENDNGAPVAPCRSFKVFSPLEFYRLDLDPGEMENLYDNSAYQQEVEDLRIQLSTALIPKTIKRDSKVEMNEETRQQLKSLGYLN